MFLRRVDVPSISRSETHNDGWSRTSRTVHELSVAPPEQNSVAKSEKKTPDVPAQWKLGGGAATCIPNGILLAWANSKYHTKKHRQSRCSASQEKPSAVRAGDERTTAAHLHKAFAHSPLSIVSVQGQLGYRVSQGPSDLVERIESTL